MRTPLRHRPSRPLLLAGATRAAALPWRAARWWLAAILVAVILLLTMAAPPADGTAVLIRDGAIVGQLRHGGGFYPLAADTLRSGGEALRPALAFPLPALPMIVAHLPPLLAIAVLVGLAAGVAMAWQARLMPLCRGSLGQIMVLILLIAGLGSAARPDLIAAPETWAGLLIALSLASRRPGHAVEAIALGFAAASLAGIAAIYLLLMALLAWRDGHGRETAGWAFALLLLGVVFGFHVHAVTAVVRPLDAAAAMAQDTGWSTGLSTIAAATGASLLPVSIGAALVGLATIGWAAWRDPLAIRASATILMIALLLMTGVPAMGGLLVAPIAFVGLVFIPDLLRDLAAAALDNRRITVRRTVR
jgi:hypothetical protein